MCNCGNKRSQLTSQSSLKINNNIKRALLQNKVPPDLSFEYHGKTALSVRESISGKNYRFNFPGDVQMIDYRDAPLMMAIPVLKKLNK